MKTSEFIKKVGELGHWADSKTNYIDIYRDDYNGDLLVEVSKVHLYNLDTQYTLSTISKELWELLIDYASTPVEEREDEKKYCLKFKGQLEEVE